MAKHCAISQICIHNTHPEQFLLLHSAETQWWWLQDAKLQKNAAFEAARKEAADLEKQLADLKADLQKSEKHIEVSSSCYSIGQHVPHPNPVDVVVVRALQQQQLVVCKLFGRTSGSLTLQHAVQFHLTGLLQACFFDANTCKLLSVSMHLELLKCSTALSMLPSTVVN